MIVPMKKLFLLLLEQEKTEGLEALRDLGVMHIDSVMGNSTLLDDLTTQRDIVFRSIAVLPESKVKDSKGGDSIETVVEIAKRILKKSEKSKIIADEISEIRKELERLKVWGDFNADDIRELDRKGIKIKLYELDANQWESIPDGVLAFPVLVKKNFTFAALVIPENTEMPEIQEIVLPEKSISELRLILDRKAEEMNQITSEINKLSNELPRLEKGLEELDSRIEFESLRSSLDGEGSVAYLSGYIPEDSVHIIKSTAEKHGWGVLIKEPDEEDITPTLVKNPQTIRIIQPVFNLLNIIPGYHERDISFFFLLFLSIFFAIIVGDAGYGCIFLGAAFYFGFKGRKQTGKFSDMIRFILVMSIATIAWGAATGTWFGSITIADLPFFKMLTIDKIASFSRTDTSELIKHICFLLGVIQISIAHIWNFIEEFQKKPRIKAFAQLGWLSMVNGLYYLVLNFVLNPVKYPIPTFAMYMIFGGLAVVVLFSEQEGNILKGIIKGFGSLMIISLDSVGAFSDIISYIRLFAVGLATVAVASSFNAIAAGMVAHGVVGIIECVFVLMLGHGLNIAMASLAIIVHGVRLNVLEFSGHLGMEWSGISYDPFRNRKK